MIVLLLLASEGVKADFLSLEKKTFASICRKYPGYFLIKSKGQSKVSLSTGLNNIQLGFDGIWNLAGL